MKDRYYTTAAAALPAIRPTPKPAGDLARTHALNWCMAVGILALAAGVGVWLAAKAAGLPADAGTLALVPVLAIVAAGVAFAVKLIRFTGEHRYWLYALEDAMGADLDGDGLTGDPTRTRTPAPALQGAIVRGVDNTLHRLDIELSPSELQALKRLMLTSGAFGVRAANAILQDEVRASALRVELHRLSILEAPKPRTATRLTAAGTKAVMRWR
ncbi:MAG TPA: hypothetical protein VM537_09895 [Anaerolineae bacterium]|nr:hypothetical protein [Anaerolineae bacterium]